MEPTRGAQPRHAHPGLRPAKRRGHTPEHMDGPGSKLVSAKKASQGPGPNTFGQGPSTLSGVLQILVLMNVTIL
eukprot:scaffold141577_cov15-Tisochrysis_lutea.AAC.1